ncbi:MAG: thiosulfate oxidation carrier complex protein SoxZ [Gammaproteobacteria bacterium]|nr:thiosulfate oxidation carrier complex protein SoxZ [Gammaproteobacteria bacterium]MDH3857120.1 thiosulfate oxidation carrier complex protein SoxZ [Gammaproteobacteria bacterium]
MAKRRTRLKTEITDNGIRATCLIKHPMETGNRLDSDGNKIPIHYVKYVKFSINGEHVGTLNLGPGVSADPYLSFEIADVKVGDTLALQWEDNRGESDAVERVVK